MQWRYAMSYCKRNSTSSGMSKDSNSEIAKERLMHITIIIAQVNILVFLRSSSVFNVITIELVTFEFAINNFI